MNYNLNFNPLPKQSMVIDYLFNKGVKNLLFGGAAGSGKSYVGAAVAAYSSLYYPGIIINCMGTTKKSILTTVGSKLKTIAPQNLIDDRTGKSIKMWDRKEANEPKHIFKHDKLRPELNSEIWFTFNAQDRIRLIEQTHQGIEYQINIIDECTMQPMEGISYVLKSRTRHKHNKTEIIINGKIVKIPIRNLFMTNAGGVSAAYFKKRFVDRHKIEVKKQGVPYPIWEEEVIDPTTGMVAIDIDGNRVFEKCSYIPATIEDNPAFYLKPYHFELMGLPKKEREYKLYGNWDYVPGKFFEDFQTGTHVRAFEEVEQIIMNSNIDNLIWWVSMDYGGVNDPLVLQYWVKDTSKNRKMIYWETSHVGISDELIAKELRAKIEYFGHKYNWSKEPVFVMPHDTFRKSNQKIIQEGTGEVLGETTAELYQKIVGLEPIRASKDRLEGWRLLNRQFTLLNDNENEMKPEEYLDGDRKKSEKFIIANNCVNFINELNGAQTDKKNTADIIRGGVSDHSLDAARYAIVSEKEVEAKFYNIEFVEEYEKFNFSNMTNAEYKDFIINRNNLKNKASIMGYEFNSFEKYKSIFSGMDDSKKFSFIDK